MMLPLIMFTYAITTKQINKSHSNHYISECEIPLHMLKNKFSQLVLNIFMHFLAFSLFHEYVLNLFIESNMLVFYVLNSYSLCNKSCA